MKIRVGILGATGYTGAELLRLLVNHHNVEIAWITSEKFSGQKLPDIFPHLKGFLDSECKSVRELKSISEPDLVFSCLPHVTSAHFVAMMLERGARVIDFSADFRLPDIKTYKRLFKAGHKYPQYLKEAVYGLPELYRETIAEARLIANPGCYATSVILGLAPLINTGLIMPDSVIADIKSGLSGRGRAPSLESHFTEANEGIGIGAGAGQNQKPEMEQVFSKLSGDEYSITFLSHTAPLDRGIMATIYSRLTEKMTLSKISRIYKAFYKGERVIRVLDSGAMPFTKNVRYSNICDIGLALQKDVFVSAVAIDNLGKGASGQAVQNMNIMFGLPELEGLGPAAVYP